MLATYQDVTRKNLLEAYHDAARVQGRVPHAVQPRPPLARRSACMAENIFWAHLPEDPAHRARAGRRARGAREASRRRSRTPTSATSRCSSRCPTPGRSTSSSRSADPPAERGAVAPRGARRHHLRLRRQDRPLHRPARREARARAAPANERRLLPGHLPGRRVPGDPRRPAQPVRRHQHGAVSLAPDGGLPDRGRRRRATPSPRCCNYVSYSKDDLSRACAGSSRRRCARSG